MISGPKVITSCVRHVRDLVTVSLPISICTSPSSLGVKTAQLDLASSGLPFPQLSGKSNGKKNNYTRD